MSLLLAKLSSRRLLAIIGSWRAPYRAKKLLRRPDMRIVNKMVIAWRPSLLPSLWYLFSCGDYVTHWAWLSQSSFQPHFVIFKLLRPFFTAPGTLSPSLRTCAYDTHQIIRSEINIAERRKCMEVVQPFLPCQTYAAPFKLPIGVIDLIYSNSSL